MRIRSTVLFAACTVAMTVLVPTAWASGPVAVSPGSASEFSPVHTGCPTFSWSAVEDAEGYEVVVYAVAQKAIGDGFLIESSAEDVSPVLRQSIPAGAFSWTPSAESCLEMFGRYAWAARAVEAEPTDGWSESRMFRVDPDPIVKRIGGVLESALEQYFEARGLPVGAPGELASLIASELKAASAEPQPQAAAESEKTVFFMGQESPVSQVNAYLEQRLSETPQDPPGTAGPTSAATFGGPGGTSSLALTDEAEIVIDDEYDTAATKGILVFRSENTFDWAWAVNSSEAVGAAGNLFLTGGNGAGDPITFPAAGGAHFNDAFVLNEFQLDPKTSGSQPICNSASDEGLLYYDSTDGLCHCDGASWKKVDGGATC
ncbi:MAG: hypothetical protein ACE5GX_02375 [Thermoanaerobaculia bacterium]